MSKRLERQTGAAGALMISQILIVAGILWYRSLRPTDHVMLVTAAGERQGCRRRMKGW
ncbi:MAG TPA: hypothetical protein VEU30_05515 [Thermoanaerobaculia bacterium]|nr:hypothetical protein [Thermoanaerobaculia bacterium]